MSSKRIYFTCVNYQNLWFSRNFQTLVFFNFKFMLLQSQVYTTSNRSSLKGYTVTIMHQWSNNFSVLGGIGLKTSEFVGIVLKLILNLIFKNLNHNEYLSVLYFTDPSAPALCAPWSSSGAGCCCSPRTAPIEQDRSYSSAWVCWQLQYSHLLQLQRAQRRHQKTKKQRKMNMVIGSRVLDL